MHLVPYLPALFFWIYAFWLFATLRKHVKTNQPKPWHLGGPLWFVLLQDSDYNEEGVIQKNKAFKALWSFIVFAVLGLLVSILAKLLFVST